MMKRFSIVLFSVFFLFLFSTGVLADAAAYDWDVGEETSYDVYVATTDGGVNLRYEGTTESGIICTIPDLVKLHISRESSSGWGYTVYNGNDGWIALSQVSRSYPMKEVTKPVVVSASDGVNLREGPCVSYDRLLSSVIPTGTELTVTGLYTPCGWGQTTYNGVTGWIAMSEVKDYVPETVEQQEESVEEIEELTEDVIESDEVTLVQTDDGHERNMTLIYILLGLIIVIVATAAVIIIRILKK